MPKRSNDPDELDVRGRRKGQRGARRGTTTHTGVGNGVQGTKSGEPAGSIGQAPYVPTERDREFVRQKVWFIGQEATAKRLGISSRTLQRHFKPEIEDCETDLEEKLGKTAVQKAINGDGPMLRFLLATRFKGRWSPKIQHQHTGADGGPIRTVDLAPLIEGKSEEELKALDELLDSLAAETGASGSEFDPASEAPDPRTP
jgi:AraC-like DNA-binding protein